MLGTLTVAIRFGLFVKVIRIFLIYGLAKFAPLTIKRIGKDSKMKQELKALGQILGFVFQIALTVAVFYGFVISLTVLTN